LSDKDFKVKNKLIVNGLNNASGVILSTNNTLDSHSLLPTQYGGTGTATSPTTGQIPYSSAGTTYAPVALNTLDVKGSSYSDNAPSSPVVGQIWIESDSTSGTFDPNIIRRQAFTATAGQTVFTTTVPFIDTYEQVFFNGMLLLRTTDYTTSNSNTITLASAAAVNDIVEVVTVTNLNSVNTYTQAEVDALLAANIPLSPISISANTTLVAKKRYFVTSASALTLTLPASPTLNDEIHIVDASGNSSTYNITVARNGSDINNNAGNFIIDQNNAWVSLLYTGSTVGWKVA